MNVNINDFKTPGQLIEALLNEKGWTNRVLAIVLDSEETGISKLITDKKSVTPEIAISLEEVFGVAAEYFLTLQRDYDLAKARLVARPNPKEPQVGTIICRASGCRMIKRRWIDAEDIRDIPSVEKSIAKFFGADAVEDIEIPACREENIRI